MTNWYISGGCGFIGLNLIRYILDNQLGNIRILDNFSVGNKSDLSKVTKFSLLNEKDFPKLYNHVELINGDLRSPNLWEKSLINSDIVVHLAANTGVGPSISDPINDFENNTLGTLNILEASKNSGVNKFIFASSGAPIGETEPPIHEEVAPHPVSPYGASKLSGEGYCSAYSHSFDLETIILRFSNVYGPGSKSKQSVIAKFIKQAISGKEITIYGDGSQTRDFLYIDDLIRAIIASASTKYKCKGEIFQIATNIEENIINIANKIINELKIDNINIPKIKYSDFPKGDVKRNFSLIKKAENILRWQPEVELNEGLKKTINYFIENYHEEIK